MKIKREKRIRRHKKIRANLKGTSERPRFCVFRTPKHIYAQLIDDENGKTILSSSDIELKKSNIQIKDQKEKTTKTTKVSTAYSVGKLIAQKALEKKIKKIVFDRGGYKYHGRVKAVAEGAREEGLKF